MINIITVSQDFKAQYGIFYDHTLREEGVNNNEMIWSSINIFVFLMYLQARTEQAGDTNFASVLTT